MFLVNNCQHKSARGASMAENIGGILLKRLWREKKGNFNGFIIKLRNLSDELPTNTLRLERNFCVATRQCCEDSIDAGSTNLQSLGGRSFRKHHNKTPSWPIGFCAFDRGVHCIQLFKMHMIHFHSCGYDSKKTLNQMSTFDDFQIANSFQQHS